MREYWDRFIHPLLFRWWSFVQFIHVLRSQVESKGDLRDAVDFIFKTSVIRGHIPVELFAEIDNRLEDLDSWDVDKYANAKEWFLRNQGELAIKLIRGEGAASGFLPRFLDQAQVHLSHCDSCRAELIRTIKSHANYKRWIADLPTVSPPEIKEEFVAGVMRKITAMEDARRPDLRLIKGGRDDE